MKSTITAIAFMLASSSPTHGFAPQSNVVVKTITNQSASSAVFSTMADSGVPPASSVGEVEDGILPTKLPSDVGFDYVPLASALAAGDLAQADQVCTLILTFHRTYNVEFVKVGPSQSNLFYNFYNAYNRHYLDYS